MSNQHIQKQIIKEAIEEFRKDKTIKEIFSILKVMEAFSSSATKAGAADMAQKYIESVFSKSLERVWKDTTKIILQEIQDSSFEILFGKYLEHDDAINASEEIVKLVKKQLQSLKQTT